MRQNFTEQVGFYNEPLDRNNSRNTEQNNLVQLRTGETECLEAGCVTLRYNDTQDERKGYPWPWDEPYPYDPLYKPRTDRDKSIIRSDPRYGHVIPRLYEAELSVRKDETIRFHVRFSKGSHMKFTWMLDSDETIPPPRILPKYTMDNVTNSYPHVKLEDERCEIMDDPGADSATVALIAEQTWMDASGAKQPTTFVSAMTKTEADLCAFPFRYDGVLYYACTYINETETPSVSLCATSIDEDFNPISIGVCNTELRCPIQLPRPEETGLDNKTDIVQTITEGETSFTKTYIKAVETEIVLDRKFTVAGHIYNLTLVSYNMHDITFPNIVMKWRITCSNPVRPEDWELVYNRDGIHYGETFEMQLHVARGADLPTKPRIRIYAVTSLPEDPTVYAAPGEKTLMAPTAMRRWDHAPFISRQTPDYTIPFYIKGEITSNNTNSKRGKAEWNNVNRKVTNWWEPLKLSEDQEVPPEILTYEEYEFSYMGLESPDEDLGVVPHDGSAAVTNLKSPADEDPENADPAQAINFRSTGGFKDHINFTRRIGSGVGDGNYVNFTLCFPTIKYPGSYAFTVAMWNGISDIRYASMYNLTTEPEYFSENISLLLPGGEGFEHGSGKASDYCIQWRNGTKLISSKWQEMCESGDSLEIETDPGDFAATVFPWTPEVSPDFLNFNGSYKWMLNWIEIYELLEGPNEGTLKYVLPLEAPNDKVITKYLALVTISFSHHWASRSQNFTFQPSLILFSSSVCTKVKASPTDSKLESTFKLEYRVYIID